MWGIRIPGAAALAVLAAACAQNSSMPAADSVAAHRESPRQLASAGCSGAMLLLTTPKAVGAMKCGGSRLKMTGVLGEPRPSLLRCKFSVGPLLDDGSTSGNVSCDDDSTGVALMHWVDDNHAQWVMKDQNDRSLSVDVVVDYAGTATH